MLVVRLLVVLVLLIGPPLATQLAASMAQKRANRLTSKALRAAIMVACGLSGPPASFLVFKIALDV